jgi:uncharacterized protein YdiU (UPF0061 family)
MTVTSPSATTTTAAPVSFDNTYARLPHHFYARLAPTPVSAPRLVRANDALARDLGIDPAWLASPDGVAMLAGNRLPPGAEPIATAYAGHQFGSFVPQLGDGRAILLGEVVGRDGVRRDLQLKGAGPTPYSRRGDGRAALGPVLREYLVSETMAAYGIPTTRALAAVTTGDPVIRERVLPGAILARVAQSHIRVGTFQYFAARGDVDGLATLARHVIERHYPDAAESDDPARAMLDGIVARQARLVAGWMHVGFIHGVMNTDNTSIAGETIDYGPCAFMDTYDPATVYSSIDHAGRYAYANQPRLAQWNLGRLAEAILPLLGEETDAALANAQAAIDGFAAAFEAAYWAGWYRKLGFAVPGHAVEPREDDRQLALDLLTAMATARADMTLTFRNLTALVAVDAGGGVAVPPGYVTSDPVAAWLDRWRHRLSDDGIDPAVRLATMRTANPAFVPRNHRIEQAIAAAVDDEDFGPFGRLASALARPFDDQPRHADLMAPPAPHETVRATFCGT